VSRGEDVPVIDEPIVDQLLDLGPEIIGELVELYSQQLDGLLPQIAGPEPDERRRAAHQLKGSSANLGLARVAWLAAGIERGDTSLVHALAPAVTEGLAALRQRSG